MLPLADLKEKSLLALKFRDLICIAVYSSSPSTAFKAAQKLGWYDEKTKSCRYLAMISRDYGIDVLKEIVSEKNSESYNSICFCECHLSRYSLEMFLNSNFINCNCECCGHDECFHAAHTFGFDREICQSAEEDEEGDEDEEDKCEGCDGNNCYGCNCDDCEGCHCNFCEEEDCYHCPFINEECPDCEGCGCEECICRRCGSSEENEDDNEKDEDSGKTEDENQKINTRPFLSRGERLEQIADKIRESSGQQFELEEVNDIDGDKKSAEAFSGAEGDVIKITSALVDNLNDDELAWLIAHEAKHIKYKDGQQERDFVYEALDKVNDKTSSVMRSLKDQGHGKIARGFAGALTFAAGTATTFLTARQISQHHEREADEKAIEIVKEAGFDPTASVTALEKIYKGRLESGGFTSTHPTSRERIMRLSRKANEEKEK